MHIWRDVLEIGFLSEAVVREIEDWMLIPTEICERQNNGTECESRKLKIFILVRTIKRDS